MHIVFSISEYFCAILYIMKKNKKIKRIVTLYNHLTAMKSSLKQLNYFRLFNYFNDLFHQD